MVLNDDCQYIQDALAVIRFVDPAPHAVFQQDCPYTLVKKSSSRRTSWHLILKLMKLCTAGDTELPLNDAGKLFYLKLFRMIGRPYFVPTKLASRENGSFVMSWSDAQIKLGVMMRAYIHSCKHYIVLTKGVTPVTPKPNVLSALVFLQNVSNDISIRGDTYNGRRDDMSATLCGSDQGENGQLCDISCSFVTLTHSLLSSTSGILACLKVLSLVVEVCVQNLLRCTTRQKLLDVVPQAMITMAGTSKTVLKVINGLINQNKSDHEKLHQLSVLLKSALTFLSDLAQIVKQIWPNGYITAVRVFKRIAIGIGTIGRQLTQQKLFATAITLLSPLWPFPSMQDVLPYITHHEALCDSYYTTGRIKEAWHVISETLMIDDSLGMSDQMMTLLLHILGCHKSLFSQSWCRNRLNKSMTVLLKYPKYGDILAVGTLLYWETQSTVIPITKMDSGTLMTKATHCFKIWTQWFHSESSEILQPKRVVHVKLNLDFLRTVADLAIVNFQNVTAVKSLNYAHCLAHRMRQTDVVRAVTQTIVTLIPQLELQCVLTKYCNDPEKEDVFLDSVGLGKDGGLLCLAAIAAHHLKTGQLQKFVLVRDTIYREFPLSSYREHKDHQIAVFAFAVIQRLEAEFTMMPGSRTFMGEKGCNRPTQNALYLIRSSYGGINRIYCESRGNFPCDTVGPWKITHEFLCTVKLMGELMMYTGFIRDAKYYFLRGLDVAEMFQLSTWGAIFSSRLIELALICDNLKSATDHLQRAQSFLKYRTPTLEPGIQCCHTEPTIDFVSLDKLACGIRMSNVEMRNNSFHFQHRNSLPEDAGPQKCDMNDRRSHLRYLILVDIVCCCGQSEILAVCIKLMCLEAEIIWREHKSICFASNFLQRSLNMAHQFVRMSPCTNLVDLIHETGMRVCCLNQDLSSRNKTLAETAQKSAEIYFQNLYAKRAEVQIDCDHTEPGIGNTLSLLDIVETVGKKASGFHACNVFVASALLTRNHCNYISVLRTLPDDDFQEAENGSDNKCVSSVFDTVISAVKIATEKKQTWDNKRLLLLSSLKSDQSQGTDAASDLVDFTPDLTAFDSSFVPASGHHSGNLDDSPSLKACSKTEAVCDGNENLYRHKHHTETHNSPETEETSVFNNSIQDEQIVTTNTDACQKPPEFKNLTMHFPSLITCQNLTERTRNLQTALEQFHEFPHSLLYRQISQSLALCLWEKQMTDVCDGAETGASQVEIAAHLTASMHVTFQHTMTNNFYSKLSNTSIWEGYTEEEIQLDKLAINEALDVLRFGGDVTKNYHDRLASLPADWTVVQMTVIDFDPTTPGDKGQMFMTRLNGTQGPITIGLPRLRCQFLNLARKSYKVGTNYCHTKCRPYKSERILDTLLYLQEVVLSGHRWLLRGQLDCVRQDCVQKFLDKAGRRAVNIILQQHSYRICYTELRSLMEICLEANEADVLSLVECMWPSHVTGILTQTCMDVQKELVRICGDQWSDKRGPVILILDNELACFPWENLPDVISDSVTRIPSFVSLIALLTWHTKRVKSQFKYGVERATFTLNPIWECKRFIGNLVSDFKGSTWCQVLTDNISRCPKDLQTALKNSSVYLYFGHGWSRYSHVQELLCRTLVILLSCNSGLLKNDSRYTDGDGAPLHFLMAGCPAVIGNLQLAYIDDLIKHFNGVLYYWIYQRRPLSIREMIVSVSKGCGQFAMCGSGFVIYGLPLTRNYP